jgi:3'-phosphoadenosine 5'-phosphosulfate (PAPS) 3'-phosphatase
MGASTKYLALARGDLDALVTVTAGEKEWDTCAPELVLREAGRRDQRRRRRAAALQPARHRPAARHRRQQRPCARRRWCHSCRPYLP